MLYFLQVTLAGFTTSSMQKNTRSVTKSIHSRDSDVNSVPKAASSRHRTNFLSHTLSHNICQTVLYSTTKQYWTQTWRYYFDWHMVTNTRSKTVAHYSSMQAPRIVRQLLQLTMTNTEMCLALTWKVNVSTVTFKKKTIHNMYFMTVYVYGWMCVCVSVSLCNTVSSRDSYAY